MLLAKLKKGLILILVLGMPLGLTDHHVLVAADESVSEPEKSQQRAPAQPARGFEPEEIDEVSVPGPPGSQARLGRFRHRGEVYSVAFSSDGKTMASASADKTIRLWETATRKELRVLQGHGNAVYSVAFSPDGKSLASASADKTIRLWEAATGKEVRAIQGDSVSISSVFSPDGKTLASISDDRTIRLWETSTGKKIRAIQGNADRVYSVAFSPDGKTLVAGGSEKTIRQWEIATGKEIRTLQGHQGWVESLAFSPDGKILVSGSRDKTIRLWEAATGNEIRAIAVDAGGGQGRVSSVGFSPDGKILASAQDNTLRLWEVVTGKEIYVYYGHGSVSLVAFSPDGLTLASVGGDSTAVLWTVRGRTEFPTKPLAAERLLALWAQLADRNAEKAYDALWTLAAVPRQAVPFLEEHLKPASTADGRRVAMLIADLESDQFAVRQNAVQELEKLGDTVSAALRQKLKEKPALEARQRLEGLLEKQSTANNRASRAVQVLEHIGDAAAHKLLKKLAQGPPAGQLTQDSKAALERLAKRPKEAP
jgi:dipeptidyl aminopeptidase/acylaminoacyl peptidase